MPRSRAVALLVDARQSVAAGLADRAHGNAQHTQQALADIERLLLDVRAGRIWEFDLHHPTPVHVIVSAD